MANSGNASRIYEERVKSLSAEERLELLALIARDLADQSASLALRPRRNIMDLHGLGKEIWEGIDAQEYVNQLRDEWDRPG